MSFKGLMLASFLPLLMFGLNANADSNTKPDNDHLAAGKALTKAKGCKTCHGLSGNSGFDDPPTPKLAGQPRTYLIKSMQDYRSGARQNETMNLIMLKRTDAEIELIADYYSAQKRY